jgi:hypothetical protein
MVRQFIIIRGVDTEIEFRGLRGKYFYYCAGGCIGSIFLTLVLYILSFPVLVALLVLVLGSGFSVYYCYTLNNKYGRWGDVKQPVRSMKPDAVYQNNPFRQLLPPQRVLADLIKTTRISKKPASR